MWVVGEAGSGGFWRRRVFFGSDFSGAITRAVCGETLCENFILTLQFCVNYPPVQSMQSMHRR